QANGTVLSVKGSIETISLAGRLVALIVVAAAGIYWVDRRRTEVALLSAKGVGWAGLSAKVLLETAPLAALAAAGGWLAGTWLVKAVGPTPSLDPAARSSALHPVLLTTAVALGLLALAAALSA